MGVVWSQFDRMGRVLLDLIERARSEITVVSIAAYKVPEVRGALRDAAARGVDVRLVLETAKDSGGRLKQYAPDAFAAQGDAVSLWHRPKEDRPAGGVGMHVRAAIADSDMALVTSANLTDAALEHNTELGLLVTGGSVTQRLAEHFGALMSVGVFRRVEAESSAT